MSMHDKILQAIFAEPVRASINWSDIESLLGHLGAEVSEGAGSRVRIALHGAPTVLHASGPPQESGAGESCDI